MKCPGCYKEVDADYCRSCQRKLFDGKKVSSVLPLATPKDENLKDFQSQTKKLSISGVQLKYSLRLENNKLVFTEHDGQYILKPIPPTVEIEKSDQAPENEHLTMQIASQIFGIETAENALIYFQDGTPAYITRRFDVKADGSKYQQEDMAQLSGRTKQSDGDNFKYEGTYEEVGKLINRYAAAALPSLERFFKVVVFNYLFSNGDAHLKNFSLVQTEMGDYAFSKAYDIMSTVIHTPGEGQTALDLYEGYTEAEFYGKYGVYGQYHFRELAKRLGLPERRSERTLNQLLSFRQKVLDMVAGSFLSDAAKKIYIDNYQRRLEFMGLTSQLILEIVNPKEKCLPKEQKVELIFPRAVRLRGTFLELLPENKYLFDTLDGEQQIIEGDELYNIIPF
jgi:serine/threonine-protein kinase HipA